MKQRMEISGFSLVTALFLIVVLAVLAGYMINLRGVQQSTVVMSVQGARGLQAARAGLEYGAFRALIAGSCNASETITFGTAEPALEPFSVALTCSQSAHTEDVTTINFYELTATATSGNYAVGSNANPDYVSRRLRITVSNEPP
jgi:MSHA biogenesis protein MshP